jgi:YggT family protein
MSGTLREALIFLINTVFDLYLFILIIRILLAYAGANYFDPITQFIVKATNFIVKPVRQVIPNYRQIELSTIVIILVLQIIKFILIYLLSFGFPNILGLLVIAFADTLRLVLQTFFYAILLQAVLSWLQPNSPVSHVLYQITAPVMTPLRRMIPPIGGVDISPIPALIIIQLINILLINQLIAFGMGLSLA